MRKSHFFQQALTGREGRPRPGNLVLTLLILFFLTSCQIIEPNNNSNNNGSSNTTTDVIPDIEYSDVFANPAEDHTWIYARDISFDVKMPKGVSTLRVYGKYLGHIYKLYEMREPSENETICFCVPVDFITFDLVIDNYYFVTDGTEVIDARNPDYTHLVDSWHYMYATTLGWIMAADCALSPDYDFNDIVARFEPTFDGSVNITAMASGSPERMWLHYFDGTTDYIITPWADNGYCVPTAEVTTRDADQYSWLNWFAKDMNGIGTHFTVNTYGKGNVATKGATVDVPYTLTNGIFNVQFLSLTAINNKGKEIYARPTMGYYVSVGAYDIDKKDELLITQEQVPTMAECLMCIWPRGERPQMMIIPDASEADTEYEHIGWQWPTEGSRIDLVYADFSNWVKAPDLNWFAEAPSGWANKRALIDSYGAYLYYGYYKR